MVRIDIDSSLMKNYFVPSTRCILHRNLGPSGMALLNQGLVLWYSSIAMVIILTSFYRNLSNVFLYEKLGGNCISLPIVMGEWSRLLPKAPSSNAGFIRKNSDQMSEACKANRFRFVSFLVGLAPRSCGSQITISLDSTTNRMLS